MVGACFQPRLTRQPAESYGSYGSYSHTVIRRLGTAAHLPACTREFELKDIILQFLVVIRVIRGVVCLTYHLFRGGSPEAEPAVGHVRKNRTYPVINSTPKSSLRELKSRSGTRSRACRKKDMPRYKFHANVEASIPSAPGTH